MLIRTAPREGVKRPAEPRLGLLVIVNLMLFKSAEVSTFGGSPGLERGGPGISILLFAALTPLAPIALPALGKDFLPASKIS